MTGYVDANGLQYRVGDRVERTDGQYPEPGRTAFVERVDPEMVIVRVHRTAESWFFGYMEFAGDWRIIGRTN